MKDWAKVLGLAAIVALLVTSLAVACGGGEEEEKGERTPAAAPEGDEQQRYAREFCEAFGKHGEDLAAFVQTDWADVQDLDTARELMSDAGDVLDDLANDFEKIDPPGDIQQWHQELVSALSNGAELLREVEELFDKPLSEVMEELDTLEENVDEVAEAFYALGDPPPGYEAAFENEPKCIELEEILEGF